MTKGISLRERGVRGIGLLCVAGLAGIGTAVGAQHLDTTVLVRAESTQTAADIVRADGGAVTDELGIIPGVVARVSADQLSALRGDPRVRGIDVDTSGQLQAVLPGTTYDPTTQVGSLYETAQLIGVDKLWSAGKTGSGIGVAVIDSGVQSSSYFGTRLVAGADFSGGNSPLTDGFGHGTHIAGIIAGSSGTIGAASAFTGMAPRATVVSVKVADANGATSLLKILQGLDWVFKNQNATNIQVVNLSLGAPAYPNYVNDPLSAAVERLWKDGVAVVVSAGNIGQGMNLTSPAYDPYVMSVGALDTSGTMSTADDVPAVFSASPSDPAGRAPDFLVPARSIQSLAASGSKLVSLAPASAKIGTDFVKGTGTSQAAAIVSGVVAVIEGMKPGIEPEDVRQSLCERASVLGSPRWWQGCGEVSVGGLASGGLLSGRVKQFANATVSATTADPAADLHTRGASWQGASWQGSSWQGSSWQGSSWQGSAG